MAMQLLVGVPLEMVHGALRIGLVYVCGALAGGCAWGWCLRGLPGLIDGPKSRRGRRSDPALFVPRRASRTAFVYDSEQTFCPGQMVYSCDFFPPPFHFKGSLCLRAEELLP